MSPLKSHFLSKPSRSHFFTKPSRGGDHGHGEEGEGSGPTMDEGFPDMEVPWNPFDKIKELEQELATSKALVEEYKLKNQELEEKLVAQKNMVSRLSGNPI
jgi:hypothetical protein